MSDSSNPKARALSRRRFSIATALATLGGPTAVHGRAANPKPLARSEPLAVPQRLQTHLNALFNDQPLKQQGITLNLPPLAENGNSVALGVTLSAPETSDPFSHLYLFAEKNPLPDIARFKFAQAQHNQELSLRIRLADSQQIIAVAQTTNDELYAASASIIVTLAACIDIPL